jgi:hypothetical protein
LAQTSMHDVPITRTSPQTPRSLSCFLSQSRKLKSPIFSAISGVSSGMRSSEHFFHTSTIPAAAHFGLTSCM